MSVNENIRRLRMARGLMQSELAELIGISQNHLSQIESGKRKASVDIIDRIVNKLDLTYDDILKKEISVSDNISLIDDDYTAELETVGEKIKTERKAREMEQVELARLSLISAGYLSEIETGKKNPSVETLQNIASALETSVSAILGDEREFSNPANSETTEMFAKLMKMFAVENQDIIIHFRDLEKNLDKLSPGDIQAIADGFAMLTGKANKDIEKRFRKAGPGDI